VVERGALARPVTMAATNKCLAQSNKTSTEDKATKRQEKLSHENPLGSFAYTHCPGIRSANNCQSRGWSEA